MRRSLNIAVWILAGAGLGLLLLVAAVAAGPLIRGSAFANAGRQPVVTIRPPVFPTEAPPTLSREPSPTPEATPVPPPLSQEGFGPGVLVSVSGTEGEGLRLRNQPGLSSTVSFLAMENEVLEIGSGPREQDGYVWWYLFNPYDPTKAGWAVANYLRVIESP
ncbi:MAG TPA: hypothetical protein ENL35_09400 [Chloroflexi bacterium]|nr:hypothetical protein [Chloroflexota bacterium]